MPVDNRFEPAGLTNRQLFQMTVQELVDRSLHCSKRFVTNKIFTTGSPVAAFEFKNSPDKAGP